MRQQCRHLAGVHERDGNTESNWRQEPERQLSGIFIHGEKKVMRTHWQRKVGQKGVRWRQGTALPNLVVLKLFDCIWVGTSLLGQRPMNWQVRGRQVEECKQRAVGG